MSMPAPKLRVESSAVSRPPRQPGLIAGRYLLLEPIGEGGSGVVWRARDLAEEREIALKILGRHNDALLLRFVREQGIRIRHPHVVAPIGWVVDGEVAALSMELVAGGPISLLLREHGPLPEGYVARVLEQTLLGLSACHGAGVVHRDVKPGNLLLEPGPAPHVRLADFGVAALLAGDRFTAAPGAIGTDGFMAPEQERGAAPDPRADLYGVGAVGLYLLTGIHPRSEPDLPAGRLRHFIARLMSPDPQDRPASAEEALIGLRRLAIAWTGGPGTPNRLVSTGSTTGRRGSTTGRRGSTTGLAALSAQPMPRWARGVLLINLSVTLTCLVTLLVLLRGT